MIMAHALFLSVLFCGCDKRDETDSKNTVAPSVVEPPQWHDCERNDVSISCHTEHLESGLVVHWRDGSTQSLSCPSQCEPNGLRTDENGEVWQHELFMQGNSRYTNTRTEESVFIPLRPPSTR